MFVYTNKGKKELINTKKDIGTNAHESSEVYKGKSKSYQYILKFKNLLDIFKIEKIEFNGKSEKKTSLPKKLFLLYSKKK